MKSIPTALPDVFILEPAVFGDERGYFYEAFNQQTYAQLGFTQQFVQDNQSRSPRGILRGLHYQIRQPQDKLVRCLLWVPKGYAHGFVVTSDSADVLYKVTDYWSKEHERGLRWNDSAVGIPWPDVGVAPQLNQRDATWPLLAEIPEADRPEYRP